MSEELIKFLDKNHGLALRRLTPFGTPGVLESKLMSWLKAQPDVGQPVRPKGPPPPSAI